MVGSRVLVAVAAVFAVLAVSMFVVLICSERRERKRLSSLGMFEESLQKRADALKLFYEQMYYSCDNFAKYAGKLQEYFQENYPQGGMRDFTADIVYSVDAVKSGALSRMAVEYGLTDLELRTCCFIHLGFTWQQTCAAELLTENAYNVRCSRIRKKLRLDKDERIPDFLNRYFAAHSSAHRQ